MFGSYSLESFLQPSTPDPLTAFRIMDRASPLVRLTSATCNCLLALPASSQFSAKAFADSTASSIGPVCFSDHFSIASPAVHWLANQVMNWKLHNGHLVLISSFVPLSTSGLPTAFTSISPSLSSFRCIRVFNESICICWACISCCCCSIILRRTCSEGFSSDPAAGLPGADISFFFFFFPPLRGTKASLENLLRYHAAEI